MANELKKLRTGRSIPAKDIVAVIQARYPSFDKTMLSKCENGAKYGVSLPADARDAVIDALAPDAKEAIRRRRRGGHRLTCRIHARLDDADYEALQQQIKADGYATMQDWLSHAVKEYLGRDPKNERSNPK